MGRGVALPRRADAVVIGGGLAGASAAWFLARAGFDAVLLEARTLASGATGQGMGLVTAGLGEPYARSVSTYGRAQAREVWRFTLENHRLVRRCVRGLSLRCGCRESGGLRAALDGSEARDLRESLPLLRRDGLPGRLHAGPLPEPFVSALWMDADGLIEPAPFARGLARAAAGRGATILERTPVRVLRASPRGVRVSTPRGEVRSDFAVVATSVRLGELVPRLRGAVVPAPGFVAEVRGALPQGICHSGDFYWRPSGPGRLLAGAPSRARLRRFLRRLLPGSPPPGGGWRGVVDWGADGFPTVGPVPGAPRVLACAGFCGTGFGYATLAAKLCADIAAGGSDRVPRWMAARRW